MSPLPSWAGQRRKVERESVAYTIADSIHTASGYRLIGPDFYTCVPPVDSSALVDPVVLRAIRDFDPTIIPLYRKQRYLPPGATQPETFTHLCLGRHVKVPRNGMALFHVEMPAGATHPAPNELIVVWEAFDKRYFEEGGPGGHMPCDMQLFWFLRQQYQFMRSGRDVAREREVRSRERNARLRRQYVEEMAYRQKHLDAFVEKQMGTPGDTVQAWKAYKAKQRERRQAVKPRVFLGAGAS